jgi:hypothetical protein
MVPGISKTRTERNNQRKVVGGVPFGTEVASIASFDAILQRLAFVGKQEVAERHASKKHRDDRNIITPSLRG